MLEVPGAVNEMPGPTTVAANGEQGGTVCVGDTLCLKKQQTF
jgi:hypothetical protein